jgi:ParB family chromosome partitioning protein
MTQNPEMVLFPINYILTRTQIRSQMEDEDHPLQELADSIKELGVLSPILLRRMDDGSHVIIAGERRFRAAKMAGLSQVPAFIVTMSDETASDAQLAENIHRMNLSTIEEAKKLKSDLDKLGTKEAVMQKHSKSESWLNKRLSILNLPPLTNRLISENISADIEVINSLKKIEKKDPEQAEQLIKELKSSKGAASARTIVDKTKKEMFPKSDKPGKKSKSNSGNDQNDGVAGVPEPSLSDEDLAELLRQDEIARHSADHLLNTAFTQVNQGIFAPIEVLGSMGDGDTSTITDYLSQFYQMGKQSTSVGHDVIRAFSNRKFSTNGAGLLALVSFLHGANHETQFDPLEILGCAKQ